MSVTLHAVLFPDADPATALDTVPGWDEVLRGLGGVLPALSPAGRGSVGRELAGSLAALLRLDIGHMLVAGWKRSAALIAAARATRADPAATEVVQLAAHRITANHRPYVDVVVNGATLATVGFELGVTLDVDVLVGTVRRARLIDVQSGRFLVTAAVSSQGRELLSRQGSVDLAVTVALGEGIALLDEPA